MGVRRAGGGSEPAPGGSGGVQGGEDAVQVGDAARATPRGGPRWRRRAGSPPPGGCGRASSRGRRVRPGAPGWPGLGDVRRLATRRGPVVRPEDRPGDDAVAVLEGGGPGATRQGSLELRRSRVGHRRQTAHRVLEQGGVQSRTCRGGGEELVDGPQLRRGFPGAAGTATQVGCRLPDVHQAEVGLGEAAQRVVRLDALRALRRVGRVGAQEVSQLVGEPPNRPRAARTRPGTATADRAGRRPTPTGETGDRSRATTVLPTVPTAAAFLNACTAAPPTPRTLYDLGPSRTSADPGDAVVAM